MRNYIVNTNIIYRKDLEEKLARMAGKGYVLKDVKYNTFGYEKSEPKDLDYRVMYPDSDTKTGYREHFISECEKKGWELSAANNKLAVFQKRKSDHAEELYGDPQTEYATAMKKVRLENTSGVFLIAIQLLMFVLILKRGGLQYIFVRSNLSAMISITAIVLATQLFAEVHDRVKFWLSNRKRVKSGGGVKYVSSTFNSLIRALIFPIAALAAALNVNMSLPIKAMFILMVAVLFALVYFTDETSRKRELSSVAILPLYIFLFGMLLYGGSQSDMTVPDNALRARDLGYISETSLSIYERDKTIFMDGSYHYSEVMGNGDFLIEVEMYEMKNKWSADVMYKGLSEEWFRYRGNIDRDALFDAPDADKAKYLYSESAAVYQKGTTVIKVRYYSHLSEKNTAAALNEYFQAIK